MAFAAVHGGVFPCEFKPCEAVVEFIGVAVHAERLFVVAFGAVGAKFSFVHIVVAGSAVVGWNACVVLKNRSDIGRFLVASETIDPFMPAPKRKPRFFLVFEMFEAAVRGKRLFRVALFAVGAEEVVVGVVVTVVAVVERDT